MTSFVVLQHDDEPTAMAAEKTVFVRDAFSILALAFPIVWLFWHRLWIAGGGALVLFIAVSAFASQNSDYFGVIIVFNILLSLAVAIEGSAWRMTALRFSGYKYRSVIEAENLEQAQLKWALGEQQNEATLNLVLKPLPLVKYDDDLIFSVGGHD